MKKIFSGVILVLLFALFNEAPCQGLQYSGVSAFRSLPMPPNGYGQNFLESCKIDTQGNIYALILILGDVDANPTSQIDTIRGGGVYDIALVKISPNGAFIWAFTIGGEVYQSIPTDLTLDHEQNVLITGWYGDTVDFDPGPDTFLMGTESQTGFVAKYSPDGDFIWARQTTWQSSTMPGVIFPYAIACDSRGNVYTGGSSSGCVDFDPDSAAIYSQCASVSNGTDVFLWKLSKDGEFRDANIFQGGGLYDRVLDIEIDQDDDVIFTGSAGHGVDFDDGSGSMAVYGNQASELGFIVQFDSNGTCQYAQRVVGTLGSNKIALDPQGNIYLSGSFEYTQDFNPGNGIYNLTSNGLEDAFIAKFDHQANFTWAASFGATSYDYMADITCDRFGNVIGIGTFRGEVDFDPGANSYPIQGPPTNNGMFNVSLDPNSYFRWARGIGQIGSEAWAAEIMTDSLDRVISSGSFSGTVDFNPNSGSDVRNTVNYSGYIQTQYPCDRIEFSDTACRSYLWNATGIEYSNSGQYYAQLVNEDDCDSISILNLELLNQSDSVGLDSFTLIAFDSTSSYQWIDCLNDSVLVDDTLQWFIPDSTGHYAVILYNGFCTDTSACLEVIIPTLGLEIIHAPEFKVVPNPSTGLIRIVPETNYEFPVRVSIMSTQGILIREMEAHSAQDLELDLSDIDGGVYFLNIAFRGRAFTKALILNPDN